MIVRHKQPLEKKVSNNSSDNVFSDESSIFKLWHSCFKSSSASSSSRPNSKSSHGVQTSKMLITKWLLQAKPKGGLEGLL